MKPARTKLKDSCEIAGRILAGEFDTDLEFIAQAAQARKKAMFRKGSKVRLTGTNNPALDGKVGQVLKVNAVRVSVGVGELVTEGTPPFEYQRWSDGEFNVPPRMLTAV